jgi:hypothetical protein
MVDDLFQQALDRITTEHSSKFSSEMKPLIRQYSDQLLANDRRQLLRAMCGGSRAELYQRYAEVHMYAYLEANFHPVACPEDPADFRLANENCLIEVIAPSPGELETLAKYARPNAESSDFRTVPTQEIISKYWTALDIKQKKFQQKIDEQKIATDTSLVIGVSPILLSEAPWAAIGQNNFDSPYIIKALFSIGQSYFWVEPETGRTGSGIATEKTIPAVKGALRPTDLFQNERGKHISAAIAFGPEDGWFSPWRPIVVHNPNAANPLTDQFFPNPLSEYRVETCNDRLNVRKVF